jgi:outer membrane lipoprotein-sorting protein
MKTMRKLHRHIPVAGALILASLSSSCGFLTKTRVIYRHGKPVSSTQPLMEATRDDLNNRIARMYNAINSFQATVDMTPSEGSVYKGRITEVKDILAYVLYRKPSLIRIIGLYPVVRTKLFDMVSNGVDFKFHLSTKNLFVEGANKAPAVSKNKIENLRPDAFFSSMLIRPADDATEAPTLIDQTDEDNALYILYFLRKGPGGQIQPSIARSVWFDRLDLSIVRQIVYDNEGAIASDTRYAKWQKYGDALFPSHIDLNRPKDGYGVVMDVVDMKMNIPLTDDQFALTQPEGTQLQVIGPPPAGAAQPSPAGGPH